MTLDRPLQDAFWDIPHPCDCALHNFQNHRITDTLRDVHHLGSVVWCCRDVHTTPRQTQGLRASFYSSHDNLQNTETPRSILTEHFSHYLEFAPDP